MTESDNGQAGLSGGKIEVRRLMAGAEVICAGEQQLALGFPEEVVKAWLQQGVSPTAWIVPDVRTCRGIVQWAFEHPLYHALFVQRRLARGERIGVLVHQRDWPDLLAYLKLGLLGLTRQQMRQAAVAEHTAEMLARETEHLALKRTDGSVAAVEDFLEPHFFDAEGVVRLGGLEVRSEGDNTFSFFTGTDRLEQHRLTVDGEQAPPYARLLGPATSPVLPQQLEIVALGAASGFDAEGPCSSLVVQANGRFLLVDSGPYILTLLERAGLSRNQLSALCITHAHEDHAVGLSALLDLPGRIKLFATAETAAILRRKLAILNPHVSRPETLLDDAFDVALVVTGRDYHFGGLRLRFHYSLHSIPCTGVELSLHDGNGERRALIAGDCHSRAGISEAARSGAIDAERRAELERIFTWDGDLLLADAGGGQIHGDPADFAASPAKTVVCLHTPKLDPALRHLFTLAQPGHRYTLVAEQERPTPLERVAAQRALRRAFSGEARAAQAGPRAAGATAWLSALLDAGRALSVSRGHIVVRQGECSEDLFAVLAGELAVLSGDGGSGSRRVATIHAGEVFGEMAAINEKPRSATVMADTAARLLRIPGQLFWRLARELRLHQQLPQLWHKRADLERVEALAGVSVTTRTRLARHAERLTVAPGATIIRQGSSSRTVFVLVRGLVQLYRDEQPLRDRGAPLVIAGGSLIGETAPFLQQARNATIVALDECEVLAIRGDAFRQLIAQSPQLHMCISRIVHQRQAA